jgi:hypothetical protein
MRLRYAFIVLLTVALVAPLTASAGIVIVGSHCDHPIVPGGDITNVRMAVELSVSGGIATFTFTNVSIAPELTAVIDEIILDLHDNDVAVGGDVLWNPVILTSTPDISFTFGDSNGLPGYKAFTDEVPPLLELGADPPPSTKGLDVGPMGMGESLVVQFNTVLPDGPDRIADYLAFFDGGGDTAAYSIGFHAVSTTTALDDDGSLASLTGIYVPEPGTILMAGLGVVLVALRRLRRTAR